MTMGLARRTLLAFGGAALAAPALARTPALTATQTFLDRWVDERRIAGAVVGVHDRAGTRWVSAGRHALGSGPAVAPDSIFRIYSMTKPITALTAMAMMEQGRLGLDEPVAAALPAFEAMSVLVDPRRDLTARPATVPMTVRHLLTHTAGLAYNFTGDGPLERAYRAAGVAPTGPLRPLPLPGAVPPQPTLAAMADALAKLPLASEPGTRWRYSVGLDLLGALLERKAGRPFDTLVAEAITGPLAMRDSGFMVERRAMPRLTTLYSIREQPRPGQAPTLIQTDAPPASAWAERPSLPAGGAGMVSTPADYMRFARMLLDGGRLDGRRLLAAATVNLALSDLLPAGVRFEASNGYGAGGYVVTDPADRDGRTLGTYGWSGAASTVFWVDRRAGRAVVAMAQYLPQEAQPFRAELRRALSIDLA